MTTETLTPPVESTAVPAAAGARTNTFSVIALVLSILSIILAMTPLAIVGIVLGFIGHRDEPSARTHFDRLRHSRDPIQAHVPRSPP